MASTKKAVITAITANGIVAVCKLGAALVSGSASMMNEFIHSLMDTANQLLLYFGLREAERPADKTYAFGHAQKKYLWNLGSAVGLFSIGSGIGLMHAYYSWQQMGHVPKPEVSYFLGVLIDPMLLTIIVLGIAFILEGYSFLVAMQEFVRKMRKFGYSNPLNYLRNADDPTLIAVALEDSVAMGGLVLAGLGIFLSHVTGNPIWDITFSAMIAVLLGIVAIFLLMLNARYLADVRDGIAERAFIEIADKHKQVERYHDLRSIILDENNTILVAEIELREEALLQGLADDINAISEQMRSLLPAEKQKDKKVLKYIDIRAAVEATLKRTEHVIEDIVAEIKLMAPQVTHCTLEIEGIATPPDPQKRGRYNDI